MSNITLSPEELRSVTGYKRAADQIAELQRQGFYRAYRARKGTGPVIVERNHFEAIRSGQDRPTPVLIVPREPRAPRVFPWEAKTALYRHFDASGAVLYIGIATHPEKRAAQHRIESSWADKSHRVELEWFDSRREAMAAERAAIQAEKPPFNVLHVRRQKA